MLEVSVSESGQREDDEIELLFRVAQEDAAVGVDQTHARIVVRPIRVQLRADLLNHWIDLDCGDLFHAIRQRRRGVGASAGAEDEGVTKRIPGKEIINAAIKRLLLLPRDHALMPDAVDVEMIAAGFAGVSVIL